MDDFGVVSIRPPIESRQAEKARDGSSAAPRSSGEARGVLQRLRVRIGAVLRMRCLPLLDMSRMMVVLFVLVSGTPPQHPIERSPGCLDPCSRKQRALSQDMLKERRAVPYGALTLSMPMST